MGSTKGNCLPRSNLAPAYARLNSEFAMCHLRTYQMCNLAVLRRGRIMKLLGELELVKSLAWTSFAFNVGMAIVISVLAASRN